VRAALAASAPTGRPLHAEQSAAVVEALSRSLGLVAGGPGTGKTTIILALVETALALGVPPARIALAAPTGKAARRIEEALGRAAPSDADRPIATTLHGLLGLGPALAARGPFTAAAPLPHRLVVVDEASMIGLEMLDALTQALPADATLVLLGDPDQLPSVEAGAAFRALVESPALGAVRLTHSHRMREDDAGGAAILHAAQEIKSGRWPDLPADEGTGRRAWRGPRFLAAGATSSVDRFLIDWAVEHMGWQDDARGVWVSPDDVSSEAETRLVALLEATSRARLLAVTRGVGRPTGVGAVNAWFHARVAAAQGASEPAPPFLPGEPVMVTENDPGRGLANGDSGVILRVARRAGGTSLAAAFLRGATVVMFPLVGLQRNLVLSYAVTVHKAQGSEHDHVALLLPDEDLPILGRELLYTALTRARRSVTVVGNAELAARAAARLTLRTGTLARWLAGPDATP